MPPRKISVFTHSSSSPILAHSSVSQQRHISSHAHTRLFGFQLGFGVGASVSVILFLLLLLLRMLSHKWKQNRALTAHLRNSIKLMHFTFRELKTATCGFDNEHKLGQGGFGAVYKGVLKGGQEVAVKKLDIASFQGEREFQNELSVISHVCASPHIVRLVGFCSDGKKRLLVYEYMHNRSLQEALFDEDYPAQLYWERRFDIIVDACKALAFLHACEPPIIHGDVKPSNVLLDVKFHAKIADFGLARFRTGSKMECEEYADGAMCVEKCKPRRQRRCMEKERKQRKDAAVECTADVERTKPQQQSETECYIRQSVSSTFTTSPDSDASSSITGKPVCEFSQNNNDGNQAQPDSLLSDSDLATVASPLREAGSQLLQLGNENCAGMGIVSIAHRPVQENINLDIGIDKNAIGLETENSGKEIELAGRAWKEKQRSGFGRDWWWRQDVSGELGEVRFKDNVMDWMGYDSRRDALGSANEACPDVAKDRQRKARGERRQHSHSSELWGGSSQEEGGSQPVSGDLSHGDKTKGERGKSRDAWYWWKEDNNTSDTSTKGIEVKPKDSTRTGWKSASLEWWRDETTKDSSSSKSKKRSHKDRPKSREWWKDEEITSSREWKASKKKRQHSSSREWSGEICSRGVSSMPSMRGTICYIAPENGSNGAVSEKCDVYSFGVLLLVIVSGRRPLQVMASPITEFERANLISWARQLAHSGSVLELVDPSLHGEFCHKQATLSITVALLCLQRLPSKRPSMNEVLKMLSGEMEAPSLPSHFSPSPPCRVPYRSRWCSLSSEGVTTDFSVSS